METTETTLKARYRIVQYERGTDHLRQVGEEFPDLHSARVANGGENWAQGEGREPWHVEVLDREFYGCRDWYRLTPEELFEEDITPDEVAAYLAERHGWTPEMIEANLG